MDSNHEIMKSKILIEALSFLGIAEVKGKEDNQKIIDMFISLGFTGFKDETPWCAAYVGSVLKTCKLDYLQTLHARDYLEYGKRTNKPVVGDIVVMWRGDVSSTLGHVAFYLHMDTKYVYVLGGNQSNTVSVQTYKRDRVLSFREAVLPA